MNWCQSICQACFKKRDPAGQPGFPVPAWCRKEEICCDCGIATTEGVYDFIDPKLVNFPRPVAAWDEPGGMQPAPEPAQKKPRVSMLKRAIVALGWGGTLGQQPRE